MPAVQVGSICPIRHHLTMTSSTSTNPIVLITGANTGLGLAIVKALYQSTTAYTILLCGRSIQKAQDAANQIQAGDPSGSDVVPMQVDLESDESIEKLARDVGEKYGRVDILINNAGTYIHLKFCIIILFCFVEIGLRTYRSLFRPRTTKRFHIRSRSLEPHLERQRNGHTHPDLHFHALTSPVISIPFP
jgi:NAD(P)-dependent dehydrogenase (short-subunit alcohol dehydrogenase family)